MGDVVTLKPVEPPTDTLAPFSFVDFPKSVTQLQAEAEHSAGPMTARDLLIDMLRSLDAGEYPGIKDMVICWARVSEDDVFESYGASSCGTNRSMRIAALESAKLGQFFVVREGD